MKHFTLPILTFITGLAVGWFIVELNADTHSGNNAAQSGKVIAHTKSSADQEACEASRPELTRAPMKKTLHASGISSTQEDREQYVVDLARRDFEQQRKNSAYTQPAGANSAGNTMGRPETIERESSPAETFNSDTISEEWAKSHVKDITDSISTVFPKAIAERMGEFIGENSQYVKPRDRVMNDTMDQDWAMYKQDELRYIIQSSPYAAAIEVNTIHCKQLMCELIGAIKSGDAWEAIFNEINNQAENIIPPWKAGEQFFSTISIDDKGNQVVYAVLAFSA